MNFKWHHKSVLQLIADHKNTYGEDPVEIIRSVTRNKVLQAFTKGWNGPPFNLFEMIKILGFEVMPNDLIIDARISSKPQGKFLIEFNPLQSPSRVNFSLAHEIGHTLFSDCAETVRYRNKGIEENSWELEFLCNIAASEILLPYAKFYSDAIEIPLSIEGLKSLAIKYQASLESVFIRFCEFIDKPCMVLICQFNDNNSLKMQYMVKSSSCELDVPSDDYIIPKDSKAYECVKAGWTSHQIEHWKIFKGNPYKIYAIGLPPIRKQIQPRVGILIVPEHIETHDSNSLYIVQGDATEPRGIGNKIIGQVVNTSAGSGFGFGKAMSKKFPESKTALNKWKENKKEFKLGHSQLVQLNSDTWVFQMIAQEGIFPKYGQIPLKYDSLKKCLTELSHEAKSLNASVHMPMIGAGQAKGDWNIIQNMIKQEIVNSNINVTIYTLPNTKQVKQNNYPDLFDNVNS